MTTRSKKANSSGKATRVMSLSMIAVHLDVARNTVMSWVNNGCPVEKEPSKKGESYELDLADVVNWRIQREIERAAVAVSSIPDKPGSAPDGLETEEEAKARKARADADIADVKAAEAMKSVTLNEDIEAMVLEKFSRVVAALSNTPSELAEKTYKLNDPAEVKAVADKILRKTMKHLVYGTPEEDGDDHSAAA